MQASLGLSHIYHPFLLSHKGFHSADDFHLELLQVLRSRLHASDVLTRFEVLCTVQ